MKTWFLLVELAVISVFAVCRSIGITTSFERKPFSRRTSNFLVWGNFRKSHHPASWESWKYSQASRTISNCFKPFQTVAKTIANQLEPVLGAKWTFHDDLYKIEFETEEVGVYRVFLDTKPCRPRPVIPQGHQTTISVLFRQSLSISH